MIFGKCQVVKEFIIAHKKAVGISMELGQYSLKASFQVWFIMVFGIKTY